MLLSRINLHSIIVLIKSTFLKETLHSVRYLHSIIVLIKLVTTDKEILTNIDLHSIIVLIKYAFYKNNCLYFHVFTFHYSTNQIKSYVVIDTQQINLHSIIVLIKFGMYVAIGDIIRNLHSIIVLIKFHKITISF